MGVVYYGIYPRYYETARTELMREIGLCYNDLENQGIIMPVVKMQIEYLMSARYDEVLTVKVFVKEMPAARIRFYYEIYNQSRVLLNKGFTDLSFIKAETLRACRPPQTFLDTVKRYFNH